MVAEIEPAKAVPDARAFLLKLFASRFGSRLSTTGTDVWRSLSQFYALSDEELLASIENGAKTYRALCIDDREAFLLFSFSPQGRDEDVMVWQAFTEAMARLGVNNLRLFQLSEADDYQVYLHFEKLSKIAPLQERFSAYLAASGLERVKVHGAGDYFVLPLQSGFRWMNEAVQPVVARREMSLEVACNFFLAELLKSTICADLLAENLNQELSALEPPAIGEATLDVDMQDESSTPPMFERAELPDLAAVCEGELDLPEGQEVFAAELEIITEESATPEALVIADEPEVEAIFQREELPEQELVEALVEESVEEPVEALVEEVVEEVSSELEVSAAIVERLFQLDPLDEGQSESLPEPAEPGLPTRTVSSDCSIVPAAYGDSDDLQIEADTARPMRYVQLYFPFAEGLVKPTYFEEMPVRRPTKRRGRICLPD
ncbi:MAG TPA: hypothetical protein PLC15_04765 [Candidatus Obscuribacter sp.]|nr:hypothetical protein [Candidatus Obscuribacter sp.]HNB14664.1 hypothetical protein [Candidatus Obscuribacter sp.]HNG19758.1 hypothetical protein [Candidatus Obscuribacter sp.]HNG74579.1 hypothetical protein [Candidatus Obscuribacter sp.]HNH72149.1 hypothetical protein [Candidatus Obscuribacter sp.]